MAGTFKFELVTPERIALSEDADRVVVPGIEGDFTVLAGHAPVISVLRPGVIDVTLPDARTNSIYVGGGFAEVDAEHVTVLAEKAYDVSEMDAATISAELEKAQAGLAGAASDRARLAAASAVERLRALQK